MGRKKSCRNMFSLEIMLFSLKMVYGFYRKVPLVIGSPRPRSIRKIGPFRNGSFHAAPPRMGIRIGIL